jgi:ubiquinone/menaquinone biosynthesis C-methylase UbiE/uncharacterized protein YbaR (Trm112 family)
LHPDFQKIFAAPGSLKPLKYDGTRYGVQWKDGVLKTADGLVLFPVREGIPDFVPTSVPAWSEKDIDEIRKGDWIRRNWESQIERMQTNLKHKEFCKNIAEYNGLILDVASGPGGGNMPGIVYINSEAKVLMSDLSAKVLHEWQLYLKTHDLGVNVSFAAFDATNMPIHSNSFDIVTSYGGFSNIPNTDKALVETYRILKKRGLLYVCEGKITQESFSKLPKNVQIKWREKISHLKTNYEELIKKAGFSITSYFENAEKALSPDEADLPAMAAKYGVILYYVNCYICAEKK